MTDYRREIPCRIFLVGAADKGLQAQVDQLAADLRAHQLMAEVVLHGICFEVEGINRTRLLAVADTVHRELVVALNEDDPMVHAFSEQKERLTSLLVDALIQASTPSTLSPNQ